MKDSEWARLEARHVRLRVGTFECDLDAACRGTVKVDGKALAVRSLSVRAEVGELAVIVLEVVPLALPGPAGEG